MYLSTCSLTYIKLKGKWGKKVNKQTNEAAFHQDIIRYLVDTTVEHTNE